MANSHAGREAVYNRQLQMFSVATPVVADLNCRQQRMLPQSCCTVDPKKRPGICYRQLTLKVRKKLKGKRQPRAPPC